MSSSTSTEDNKPQQKVEQENIKILVVDDDAITRSVLSNLLKKLGYEVKTAAGGKQALELISQENFHLMLVDVMMPEMDGFSLLRMFKQAIKKEVPTIMMSSSTSQQTISEVFRHGAEDFLQKPIKEELLRARIQKCLELRNRKLQERYLQEQIKEEQRLKENLHEQLEKNKQALEEYKKQVSETIETPMQAVMSTIKDLMDTNLDAEQYKVALMTVLKSLGSSDLYKPAFVHYIQQVGLDQSTRNWLVNQFTNEETVQQPKNIQSKTPTSQQQQQLPKVQPLPFDLDTYVPSVPLRTLAFNALKHETDELKKFIMYMFKDLNLFEAYNVSPIKLWNFLETVQREYRNNYYHNFRHCVDVTQYVYFLITDEKIGELLNQFNKFVLLVAAICHDIGHPGVNNNFLINTRDELALWYNDRSVLENHHASKAAHLMLTPNINILEGLSEEQFREFRKTFTQIILATDMASHFSISSKFEMRLSMGPLSKENPDDHFQLMKIIMKCADISNITRPFEIAKEWAALCLEEFACQGDKEKALGLPVSPLMDRDTVNFPKSQTDFSDFIAGPLFMHLVTAFPHLNFITQTIQENRKMWRRLWDFLEEYEKQHPPGPYTLAKAHQILIAFDKHLKQLEEKTADKSPVDTKNADTPTPAVVAQKVDAPVVKHNSTMITSEPPKSTTKSSDASNNIGFILAAVVMAVSVILYILKAYFATQLHMTN